MHVKWLLAPSIIILRSQSSGTGSAVDESEIQNVSDIVEDSLPHGSIISQGLDCFTLWVLSIRITMSPGDSIATVLDYHSHCSISRLNHTVSVSLAGSKISR
jgi:hypothetical protein